jgi:hypothetical protein
MLSSYVPDYVPAYIINLPTSKSNPKFQQRIPGEYKMQHATAYRSFGPFPGSVQTAVPLPELRYMDIPIDPNEDTYPDMGGRHYTLTDHTAENKMRTLPATISKDDNRMQQLILCMVCKPNPNSNETWLKSAYLNHETQTISLYTSTNCKDKLKRPVATHAPGWFIGKFPMAAPLAFWRELKKEIHNMQTEEPMRTIADAVRNIIHKAGIKNKTDLDNWCGNEGRKKLYDEVQRLVPEHYNNSTRGKTPDNSVRRIYQAILPGYRIYRH